MGSSTRANPPGASTLGVTALNVGMNVPDAFGKNQGDKVSELAVHVYNWLAYEGPAVVGLNEIAPGFVQMLVVLLREAKFDVHYVCQDSNCFMWRTS